MLMNCILDILKTTHAATFLTKQYDERTYKLQPKIIVEVAQCRSPSMSIFQMLTSLLT